MLGQSVDNLLDEHNYSAVGFAAPVRLIRIAFTLAGSQ